MAFRLSPCFLLAVCVCAQNPADLFTKAPPHIDQALRDNVTRFYQAHVDGKFRAATQYIAEDSQDVFFEADKRRCQSFEIVRIDYEEEFSKATVVIRCETDVLLPPKGRTQVQMPLPSKWKVEGGKWLWYVPSAVTRQSPFGTMKPGEGRSEAPTLPSGPSLADLARMVIVDRSQIEIPIGSKSEHEVTITNSLPGILSLSLDRVQALDLAVRLDRTELKQNESATLKIDYDSRPDQPRNPGAYYEIRILAQPVNRTVPILVRFIHR